VIVNRVWDASKEPAVNDSWADGAIHVCNGEVIEWHGGRGVEELWSPVSDQYGIGIDIERGANGMGIRYQEGIVQFIVDNGIGTDEVSWGITLADLLAALGISGAAE
jgi:hypothetical protein